MNAARVDSSEFVRREECVNKSRFNRWTMGVFIGLISVFLTLLIYTVGLAADINNKYNDVQSKVITVEVKQEEVINKLNEIKTELGQQRVEQTELLQRILNVQLELAKYSVDKK